MDSVPDRIGALDEAAADDVVMFVASALWSAVPVIGRPIVSAMAEWKTHADRQRLAEVLLAMRGRQPAGRAS